MVNGLLLCSLMNVSIFFILMMDLEDVKGKWIEYDSRRNTGDFGYVETFLLWVEDASASISLAIWFWMKISTSILTFTSWMKIC